MIQQVTEEQIKTEMDKDPGFCFPSCGNGIKCVMR